MPVALFPIEQVGVHFENSSEGLYVSGSGRAALLSMQLLHGTIIRSEWKSLELGNRAAVADVHVRLPILGSDIHSLSKGSELTTADS